MCFPSHSCFLLAWTQKQTSRNFSSNSPSRVVLQLVIHGYITSAVLWLPILAKLYKLGPFFCRLKMVSRMAMLSGFLFWLVFEWSPALAYSPRTPDRVSETDIQRLLHGVMEQLGIARPRVEYPAHQAMNLVGPQSIEGMRYSKLPMFPLSVGDYGLHLPGAFVLVGICGGGGMGVLFSFLFLLVESYLDQTYHEFPV